MESHCRRLCTSAGHTQLKTKGTKSRLQSRPPALCLHEVCGQCHTMPPVVCTRILNIELFWPYGRDDYLSQDCSVKGAYPRENGLYMKYHKFVVAVRPGLGWGCNCKNSRTKERGMIGRRPGMCTETDYKQNVIGLISPRRTAYVSLSSVSLRKTITKKGENIKSIMPESRQGRFQIAAFVKVFSQFIQSIEVAQSRGGCQW